MISIGLVLQEKSINSFKIDSLATNTNLIIKRKENNIEREDIQLLKEIKVETTNASLLRQEVFEGMTLDELAEKINRTLKNEISGQGYTIANDEHPPVP